MTDETRRYLLGLMSEPDEVRFEESVVGDAARHEEVDASATELLDDYHGGRLSPAERGAFERRMLATPHGRLRLRAARALHRRAAAMPRPVRWRRWTLFVAPALAAAAVLALWFRAPSPDEPTGGDEVSFTLARTTRDAPVPELAIPRGAVTVRLALPLSAAETQAASAIALAGPGHQLAPTLDARAGVTVRAADLAPGLWELTVTTADGPLYFSFRVR